MSIKDYRAQHKLSQEQMAERLDIGQAYLSELEQGKKPVSKKVAWRLFELDPSQFPLAETLNPGSGSAAA